MFASLSASLYNRFPPPPSFEVMFSSLPIINPPLSLPLRALPRPFPLLSHYIDLTSPLAPSIITIPLHPITARLNPSAMPISNPTTTTTQSDTAARARLLLLAFLLASSDNNLQYPTPTASTNSTTTPRHPSSNSNPPARPPPPPTTSKRTTQPHTAIPPTHRPHQHQHQQRQTLVIDASTRIGGHVISLAIPPPAPLQPSPVVNQQLILAALAQGVSVEVKTGCMVVGCKNVIGAPADAIEGKAAPELEAAAATAGKNKRGRTEDEGKAGREAKRQKVAGWRQERGFELGRENRAT